MKNRGWTIKKGDLVTNVAKDMVGKVADVHSDYYILSHMVFVYYAIKFSEVGNMEFLAEEKLKKIDKKQYKKIKKDIEKKHESKVYKYKNGNPVSIGDIIRFEAKSDNIEKEGCIVEFDEFAKYGNIKVELEHKLPWKNYWITVENIIKKVGKYKINLKKIEREAIKSKSKTRIKTSYSHIHNDWFGGSSKGGLVVANPCVYEEGEYPKINKSFLDKMRGNGKVTINKSKIGKDWGNYNDWAEEDWVNWAGGYYI